MYVQLVNRREKKKEEESCSYLLNVRGFLECETSRYGRHKRPASSHRSNNIWHGCCC
jgi:hypothetical protein